MSLKMKDREHHTDIIQRKKSKQSLEEKKATLRRQIQALQNLKSEAQYSLDTSIFKVQNSRNDFSQTNDFSGPQLTKLPIGNWSVKNELFYFAGIQCTKCTRDEFIFKFVTNGEGNKTCVYSVQIFNIDNRGVLGKWVLPLFMDIELILKETPLDNITRAAHFVRNCKKHIDCYHNRTDQLIALKKSTKDVVNCFLNERRTCQVLSIELLDVYDTESDNKINILIYLIYDLKETRPHQIKVDSIYDNTPLNKETEKDLISYLKSFKKLTLIEAFESIEKKKDSRFLWERTYKEQSLTLEYQDSEQCSSDEYEPQRKRRRKRSLRISQEETSTENESIQKVKRKGNLKRTVKIDAIQKRNNKNYQKPNTVDISKFLSQYKHHSESEKESSSKESQPSGEHIKIKFGVNQKKAQQKHPMIEEINEHETSRGGKVLRSTNSQKTINSPQKSSPKKVTSPKKINAPQKSAPKKVTNPKKINAPQKSAPKQITNLKKINSPQKSAPKKITNPKKINAPQKSAPKKITNLKKINAPQKSAPKKITSPKKINFPKKSTPKKVVTPNKMGSPKKSTPKIALEKKETPRRRLVTPKKIALSKKALSSKITISPNTLKTKMKQTNLKFPISSLRPLTPRQNSPSKMINTVKVDYKSKIPKSKVVTSTPMPLIRKNVKRPAVTDLDISNISSNINQEASKVNNKSSVVLKRLEIVKLGEKAIAKSGNKKASPVKNRHRD